MENLRNKGISGQAMIEFVLGMVLTFSFFFFYVKMCAVFAIGNYIHYATFMAARAYSSSAATPDVQQERAEEVMRKMVKGRFRTVIRENPEGVRVGPGPYFEEGPQNSWNQGATYSFSAKLALYPWSTNRQSIELDLTSESWMLRNASRKECEDQKNSLKASLNAPGLEWDNGC
jgi:hypothetical protein